MYVNFMDKNPREWSKSKREKNTTEQFINEFNLSNKD